MVNKLFIALGATCELRRLPPNAACNPQCYMRILHWEVKSLCIGGFWLRVHHHSDTGKSSFSNWITSSLSIFIWRFDHKLDAARLYWLTSLAFQQLQSLFNVFGHSSSFRAFLGRSDLKCLNSPLNFAVLPKLCSNLDKGNGNWVMVLASVAVSSLHRNA